MKLQIILQWIQSSTLNLGSQRPSNWACIITKPLGTNEGAHVVVPQKYSQEWNRGCALSASGKHALAQQQLLDAFRYYHPRDSASWLLGEPLFTLTCDLRHGQCSAKIPNPWLMSSVPTHLLSSISMHHLEKRLESAKTNADLMLKFVLVPFISSSQS